MENPASKRREKLGSDSGVESGDQHTGKKIHYDVAAGYQPFDSAQLTPLLDKAYNAIRNVKSLDGLDPNIFSNEETKKLIANIKKNFKEIKDSATASKAGNSWSEICTAARTNSHVRDALTYIIDIPAKRAYEMMRKTTLSPEIVNFANITDEGTKNLLNAFFSMSKEHGIDSGQAIAAWKDIEIAARTNSSISTALDRIAQVSIRKARDAIQLAGGDPDLLELERIEDQNTKKALKYLFDTVSIKEKHPNKERAWAYIQKIAKMDLQIHKALAHIAEIPYIQAALDRNRTRNQREVQASSNTDIIPALIKNWPNAVEQQDAKTDERKLRFEYELLSETFVIQLKKYVDANTNPSSKRQISNKVQRGEAAQMEFVPRNANRYNNQNSAFTEEISEIAAILYRTKVEKDSDLDLALGAVRDLRNFAKQYRKEDLYAQGIIREFESFDQKWNQSQE
jgi:hypothetical protein